MRAQLATIALGSLAIAGLVQVAPAMQAARPGATASLVDPSGANKGTATFAELPNGSMRVTVNATGLPAGVKGLHIHMTGKCEGPGFTSAGAHWNPTTKQHGTKNPQGPHLGDFQNIRINARGTGTATATIANSRLREGPNALMDADGAAIMIHATADDYRTDPSGNSGGRIACGVVQAS